MKTKYEILPLSDKFVIRVTTPAFLFKSYKFVSADSKSDKFYMWSNNPDYILSYCLFNTREEAERKLVMFNALDSVRS